MLNIQIIKTIYYAHFQSGLQYGIMNRGFDSDFISASRIQKRVSIPTAGINTLESRRNNFKN
jgi:hypothetical protein